MSEAFCAISSVVASTFSGLDQSVEEGSWTPDSTRWSLFSSSDDFESSSVEDEEMEGVGERGDGERELEVEDETEESLLTDGDSGGGVSVLAADKTVIVWSNAFALTISENSLVLVVKAEEEGRAWMV
jgi:hypothetical protein